MWETLRRGACRPPVVGAHGYAHVIPVCETQPVRAAFDHALASYVVLDLLVARTLHERDGGIQIETVYIGRRGYVRPSHQRVGKAPPPGSGIRVSECPFPVGVRASLQAR